MIGYTNKLHTHVQGGNCMPLTRGCEVGILAMAT
jgi:hypothetical protein